jgi:hypothetical protein
MMETTRTHCSCFAVLESGKKKWGKMAPERVQRKKGPTEKENTHPTKTSGIPGP